MNKNHSDFSELYYSINTDQIFRQLSTRIEGLTAREAASRLRIYGLNILKSSSARSSLNLLLSQFKSPVTILLIIAAVLSAALGDVTNAVIILVIVLISALLSFWQEKAAGDAVKELLKLVQLRTNVRRAKKESEITAEHIVPGDIILLTAGDMIPADSILIESENLFVDEATFTGETFPVEKSPGVVSAQSTINQRKNSLLMGTHVVSGTATAVVVKTGRATELGKISDQLRLRIPETDFEKGIRRFGYMLMEITLLLVIIIFAVNVFLHKPVLDSFMFSLALAVGLTPQLLPAIISVNLATGAKNMAQEKVIVKRLSSIENFGGMNVLCSDKTGTITKGEVQIKDTVGIEGSHNVKVLKYAWLNAFLQKGFHNPIDRAICSFFRAEDNDYKSIGEIPYDFIRKRLTVLVSDGGNKKLAITKGAVSNILEICTSVESCDGKISAIDSFRNEIENTFKQLSDQGYRTLGIAYKASNEQTITKDEENNMIFLGFITLFDPLKEGIAATIARMGDIGVKLKVITGDNALVAKNLAKQLGIKEPRILTGAQLQQMSEAALMRQAGQIHVFAEVEPNQKERIIHSLKKAGNVVGFMGDGINDAPALHAADVGISVDTAVDVAKEAADIVLLNKDLDVLVDGVVAGRKTFTNTMKYIFMATSANFGNMFSMAGASLFLPFLPLLPKQILLTNLLTDFPEMAIATDSVDEINIKSPQRWNMSFIRRFMIVFGLLSSVFDYLTFGLLLLIQHAAEKAFRTGWFIESVISATAIVLVIRTPHAFIKSLPGKYLSVATIVVVIFVIALPYTPLAVWLGFVPMPLKFYFLILPLLLAYLLAAEVIKKWFYKEAVKPRRRKKVLRLII